ncbi:potassium channel family protein [Bifidobacterium sp. ESL0784]|uniref:potassium channel family protein n=1 Tax=Bifidobacterium sp. ESL0784 TaxID=2983231 RepID=UPI0023F8D696|nr:potassium channel family protein [Bifidobacterium sp. ESL0784]MDF7641568.1 potassium channel family protein [Bifidobacterium sp. ESL0784]
MRLKKWESATEWPLTILSIVFLVVYAWQILAQPSGLKNAMAEWTMNVLWFVFALDYLISFVLADGKWHFFKTHLFDLAVVVLPVIRPLRALRVLTALNALHKTSGMALRGKIIIYVVACAILLVFIGSLAVLDAERNAPGANIQTWPEALWWTFVTITTVGYGDYTPVTPTGRIIAFVLMLAGIGIIGVVTGTFGSWIVDEVSADEKKSTEITREQIEEVSQRLNRIEQLLEEQSKEDNRH